MKRICSFILSLTLILGLFPSVVFAAPDWPSNIAIESDGGIVIDADSGAVLFGKNLHQTFFPASITKVLTALIVIEECGLDEEVTFSHDAVYNVEAGSSNANLEEGDVLSVKDCLYALLLQSANEAANALAEHVAGSREAFAELMNQKAQSLGCVDSHFSNPSGLNDENHYTSAYDMALICQAAIQNSTFLKIDGSRSYKLPPTKRNPEGLTITAHHAMLNKNDSRYYPGIFGGKTGYTSLAGNTLVTFAARDGMTLIAVVLNGHQTHYTDTKAMLDFGFENFQTVNIKDVDSRFSSLEQDMSISGIPASQLSDIALESNKKVTLPNGSSISDAVMSIQYDLDSQAPENALAQVTYTYNDRTIGSAYLLNRIGETSAPVLPPLETETGESLTGESSQSEENTPVSESAASAASPEQESSSSGIPGVVWAVIAIAAVVALLSGAFIFFRIQKQKKEEELRRRRERRRQRLREIGVSDEEFEQMMAQRRANRQQKR